MASEVKILGASKMIDTQTAILQAIFPATGGAIPPERVGVVPQLLGHIETIISLAQGEDPKPKARRSYPGRLSDPVRSVAVTDRIMELYAELGPAWSGISQAIAKEFGLVLSGDAVRNRYRTRADKQEGYAALSGAAVYTTPSDLKNWIEESKNPAESGQEFIPHEHPVATQQEDKSPEPSKKSPCQDEEATIRDSLTVGPLVPVDPVVDPKPGQQVAQRPDDQQIEAIKKEALKLYQEGRDVGSIARQLGVRAQWLRGILPPVVAPEPNSPGSPDSSPPKKEASPLSEAEIDAELIRLQDTGMSPKEIRKAMLYRGVEFGLAELRDRLTALARKALQDRKAAKAAGGPEIPPDCTRAQLDAVMWQLWDHGRGKTPDEISDILCNHGYSYGAAMVERRLRQQGAEL